ncbi:MAG: HD domain-containing protein [Armatimonadetes bacterium]|nr:HD domain-containing protein [Armatimonadota bacterium]
MRANGGSAGWRLLVADHDTASRREALTALRGGDFEVFEAADFPSATQVIQRAVPDVAIIEESLQGTTGVPWQKWLDSIEGFGSTRIIALTEDRRSRTRARVLSAGADAVVTKPASAEELVALIESLCRRIDESSEGDGFEAHKVLTNGWIRALALRDIQIEGHCTRVAALTVDLARYLKLPPKQVEELRYGALLHDVGKLGIPDTILGKRGGLDPEERARMRLHPEHARDLFAGVEGMKEVADIACYHHERWDGSGYPDGLAGESIPYSARLFSIVDVYDALRSERPYKPAWPEDQALETLKAGAGTQFDPDIVAAFLEMMAAPAEKVA